MENDSYSLDKLKREPRPSVKADYPVSVPIGVVSRGAPQYEAFMTHMPRPTRSLFAPVSWELMRGGVKFEDIIVLRGARGCEAERLRVMCVSRCLIGKVTHLYAVSAGDFETHQDWATLISPEDRKRFLYVSAFKPLRKHLRWHRLITLHYAGAAPYKRLEDAIQPQLTVPGLLPNGGVASLRKGVQRLFNSIPRL